MADSIPPCPPPRDVAVLKLFADELASLEMIRDRLAEQYGRDWANLTICRLIRTRKLLIIEECYDLSAPGAPPEVYMWSQEDIDSVWKTLLETDPASSLPPAFQRIYSAVVANGFVALLIAESQPANLFCTITMRPACVTDSETELDGESNDSYPEPRDGIQAMVQAIDKKRDRLAVVTTSERVHWVESQWSDERKRRRFPETDPAYRCPARSSIERALLRTSRKRPSGSAAQS